MRTAVWALAAVVVLGGLGLAAWAADGEGDNPRIRVDAPREGGEVRRDGERREGGEVRRDGERREGGEVRRDGERRDGPVAVRGEFGRLAEVVGLNDDQRRQLNELNAAREKAIQEIVAKFQADVAGLLTAEQKGKWNATVLLGDVQRRFGKANLTEEQLTKIKAAAAAQAGDALLLDEKARGDAGRKLNELIVKEVLTDDQKALFREGGDRPREGGDRPREGGDRPREGGDRPREGGDRPREGVRRDGGER